MTDEEKGTTNATEPNEALKKTFNLGLNAEQWTTLQAALDAPPRVLPRMQELLTKPGFFDSKQEPIADKEI